MKYLHSSPSALARPYRFALVLTLLALGIHLRQTGRCNPCLPDNSSRGWVSLPQWAKENDFKLIWSREPEGLTLTNRTASLSFKGDSLLAEINGVNVWLGEPISVRDGLPCLSSLDLQATIRPILFPQKKRAGTSLKTICLDPGHGGKDTGGASGKYLEKQYTLLLAKALAGQLRAAGFKVLLTRTKDKFMELADRPAFANQHRADLFISLHFNVTPRGTASGVEVYCLTPAMTSSTNARGQFADKSPMPGNRHDAQNILLAYQLQKSLVSKLSVEDRGLRRARFSVLRTAAMPAVLIEGGFLSDADEQKKIANPKYRTRMAEAIVHGALAYKHSIES